MAPTANPQPSRSETTVISASPIPPPVPSSSSMAPSSSTSALATMEVVLSMLHRLEVRLDALEHRWTMAHSPPRPEPDPPYGMPLSWRLPTWDPSGNHSTAPPVTSYAMPQPSVLHQHPPTASDAVRSPLGFRQPSHAPRPSPTGHHVPWESPWTRSASELCNNHSAWDHSVTGAHATAASPDLSRLIRMDPHVFDGSDAQCWVTNIQYYFDHIMLPEDQRLHYVVMLFSPPASNWIFSYRANNPQVSWTQFLEDVRHRFDPHYFVDSIKLIAKLTQSGSLAEYHREFESMLNRVQGLPESTLLPIYLGGLRQPVKNQVRFQHPTLVAAAMALATEFDSAAECSITSTRRPSLALHLLY